MLDFVNMSNPVSAALTALLTAAAPTVQAAATVAVAASIAASAGAAVAGGAAGGGSVGPAAIGGAQRNSLMGTLGGAPTSCDDPRATGTGGGWTMGRLGMGSASNPCTNASTVESTSSSSTSAAIRRRRLAKGGRASKRPDKQDDGEGALCEPGNKPGNGSYDPDSQQENCYSVRPPSTRAPPAYLSSCLQPLASLQVSLPQGP